MKSLDAWSRELHRVRRLSTSDSSIMYFVGLLYAVLFFVPFTVFAQQDVGFIEGTVADSTGAAVPNAQVSIVNERTGLEQNLTTDGHGFYQSRPLQPGPYSISAKETGFSTSSMHGVVVDAATHVTENLNMEVGQISTTVNVGATVPTLDMADAQIANTIDTRAVQQLPVNGRSVLALAMLSPGSPRK